MKDKDTLSDTQLLESAKVRYEFEKAIRDKKITWDVVKEIVTSLASDGDSATNLMNYVIRKETGIKVDGYGYTIDDGYVRKEAYEHEAFLKVFESKIRIEIVKLRREIPPNLSSIGLSSFSSSSERMDFYDFRSDLFLQGVKPGRTMLITGPPGSGKTHFAMNNLCAEALKKGFNVTSNVKIRDIYNVGDNKKRYEKASLLSDLLIYACENCIRGLEDRGEEYTTYRVYDEAVISRQKTKQTSHVYINQKLLTHLWRHFKVIEILIEQMKKDTPPEVLSFMTHHIHTPKKGLVDFRRYEPTRKSYFLKNIIGFETRVAHNLPAVDYDSYDFTNFDIDISVPVLFIAVEKMAKKKEFTDPADKYRWLIKLIEKHRGNTTIEKDHVLDVLWLIRKNNPKKGYKELALDVRWDRLFDTSIGAGEKAVERGCKEREMLEKEENILYSVDIEGLG